MRRVTMDMRASLHTRRQSGDRGDCVVNAHGKRREGPTQVTVYVGAVWESNDSFSGGWLAVVRPRRPASPDDAFRMMTPREV